MNKILLSMAAVSALAIGAPAMAQQRGYDLRGDTRIDLSIGELQSRLQAGVQAGAISRQEAQPLRIQLRDLTRLERQFARDGLNRAERQELQRRVQMLRQQIRTAEMSGDGRWQDRDGRDGQGWRRDCPPGLDKRGNGCIPPGQEGRDGRWEDRRGDRDDRWEDRRDDRDDRWDDRRGDDGRYSSPYDRNRDGYDDRDTNRDNRVDSRDGDYRDRDYRDGDYRDGDRRRGGILGEVIDRVTGGGGLRVGQRASGNLRVLPYEYRNQFRDGNGAYYRTDGRNIYRIDARTDVVLQVYSMNR